MKLEIIKETDNVKNTVYYWSSINGKKITCHTRIEDAQNTLYRLEMIYTKGNRDIEEEVIFSKEIELPNEP